MMYWQIQAYHFLLSPGEQFNNNDLWDEIVYSQAESVAEELGNLPQFLIFTEES